MLNAMKFLRGTTMDGLGVRLRAPLRGYALAVLALLASLLLVLLYWRNAQQRELQASQAEFVAETEAISELLRQGLVNYELMARGGVSLFASVERPSAGQWQDYVDALNITARYPDMMGLGYAPYLDRSELQSLQLRLRDAGQGFYIVRPAGMREHYGPILYLEPKTDRNRAAVGYDMFAEPVRHAAMAAARDSGEMQISGRVQLAQDAANPVSGLLMYAPVYRFGVPTTIAARRAALQGWVYVPVARA